MNSLSNHQITDATPIPVAIIGRTSLGAGRQDYSRQANELIEFARRNNYLITETIMSAVSGFKVDERKDLERLLDGAKRKLFRKVLVVEISRLGRKAKVIRHTIDTLHSYGVSVVFKNLGGLESLVDGKETFVTNVIIAVFAELAEEERKRLVENINSGLAQAKRNGKTLGRRSGSLEKPEIALKKYPKLVTDIRKGLSLAQCAKLHSVSKNTVIKIKKLLN
jgi:DNA invertase Pin-like site-specific DNA recombinase